MLLRSILNMMMLIIIKLDHESSFIGNCIKGLEKKIRGSDKLFKKALEINQQDVKAYFNRGAC